MLFAHPRKKGLCSCRCPVVGLRVFYAATHPLPLFVVVFCAAFVFAVSVTICFSLSLCVSKFVCLSLYIYACIHIPVRIHVPNSTVVDALGLFVFLLFSLFFLYEEEEEEEEGGSLKCAL